MKAKRNQLKIAILGNSCVGKTCIIDLYANDTFTFITYKTIGIDTFYKKKTFDNLEYNFKIFDTPGDKRFVNIFRSSIQLVNGYFIVFAVDDRRSFKEVIGWINFMKNMQT